MEILEKQDSTDKKTKKYVCNLCNFNTYNKTDYTRHLLTKKHSSKNKTDSDSENCDTNFILNSEYIRNEQPTKTKNGNNFCFDINSLLDFFAICI